MSESSYDEGGTVRQEQSAAESTVDAIAAAEKMGNEAGQAAGAWVIDGNTSAQTAREILTGLEDGDPAVLDLLPSAPLSGERADDPLPRDVLAELGLAEDDYAADDALCAYEDGYSRGAEEQVAWAARAVLGLNATRVPGTDIWNTPVRAIQVGDTLSTDGSVVTKVEPADADDTYRVTARCQWVEKVATFAGDALLPVWRPEEAPVPCDAL